MQGYTGPDGGPCVACAVGTYKIVQGSDDCRSCIAGKFSAEKASYTVCLDCEAGKYSGSTSASSCPECSTGKFSGASGATSDSTCLECEAGKFSAKGAWACLDCEPGKFSGKKSATSDSTCLECEPGMFSAKAASACSKCQPGKFSSKIGGKEESSCILCGPHTYSGLSADECTQCPRNAAAPAGSVSITDCKCSVGYSGPDGGPCVASQSLSELPQINMVVELPYTVAEFTNEVRERFKQGVAAAVGGDAIIVKINSVRAASARRVMLSSRKLLSSGVDVDFSVIVPDGLDANKMAKKLTIENLNTNLEQKGIREVSAVKSDPTFKQQGIRESEGKSGSKEIQMIIFAVVPAVVVILAILACWFCWKRKTANAPQPAGGFDAHPPPVAEFAFGGFDPPPGASGFPPPPRGFSENGKGLATHGGRAERARRARSVKNSTSCERKMVQ